MTPASCPRLFEVEAARDGRLAGVELASFERHMTACPVCSREAAALEAPAAALRATSAGKRDELHVRRERTRLLATFDGELVVPGRQWSRWLWPVPVAALMVGLFIFWRRWPAAPVPILSAVVRTSSAATWSEQTEGRIERVRLVRGSLWLHVDHSSRGSRRLLVILPDGELEDIGTTFTVSADGEHTTRVEVQDGSVVLRVRGQLAVAIGPGGTWSPMPTPATPASASSASLADPIPSGRAAQPLRSAGLPNPSEPLASAVAPDPSDDFRAAMATLDAGDNAGAAAAFASFIAKHPLDPRAEDAAYLRIIALRRSGDEDSMKQAAEQYLRRYPSGFRHAEVETLSR
jgi:hypothetical protein